ncbi:phosphonopyruvate decarboxylase [Curtobacterium flaccumfaciens UCD-AKU]|uniref:hypothetical protein n=1 Tax=Curtobacterium flaccumfaciens TaxID=2035 RepID=UPI00035FB054|nr:hypothetical protein [Curtobacterium flaccumfaciens]EYT65530.1 phosphonopyruvate decarboxylase [Curtobacterium flaccumfaciens UCD-AKU]
MTFDSYVYVPCSILMGLPLRFDATESFIASREDEAMAIASGLLVAGRSPLLMMQNSGFANALNTLGSLVIAYGLPLPMLVTLRGGPDDPNPTQQPVGQATPDIFRAFGLSAHALDQGSVLAQAEALSAKYRHQQDPLVMTYRPPNA